MSPTENRIVWPSKSMRNLLPGVYTVYSKEHLYMIAKWPIQKKFIEALFLRVPNWKKTTYFSSGQTTNKLCHIYPVEDYTPTIINELQIFTLVNVTIIL